MLAMICLMSDDDHSVATGSAYITRFIPEMFFSDISVFLYYFWEFLSSEARAVLRDCFIRKFQ